MAWVQLKPRDVDGDLRMRSLRVRGTNYLAGQYVQVDDKEVPYFRDFPARVMLPPPDPEYVRALRLAGVKTRPYRPPPQAFNVFATEEEKEAHQLRAVAADGKEPLLDQAQLRRELDETRRLMTQQQEEHRANVARYEAMVERLLARESAKATAMGASDTQAEPVPVQDDPAGAEEGDDPPHVITTAKVNGKKKRR